MPLKYKVKSGDNLSEIALKYKVSVQAIKKSNNLESDKLKINQLLIIPEISKTLVPTKIVVKGKDVPISKQIKEKELHIRNKLIPDSFGYSVEVNANLNLGIAGVNGKAGINYKVILDGKYAWFPFEFAYTGFSADTIINKNLQHTIKNLKNLAKGKIKPNLSLNIAISPFIAWKYGSYKDELTPASWEKWFTSNTLAVNVKEGLGVTFGGSVFAGADDFKAFMGTFNVEKIKSDKAWFGGTVDFGFGAGVPSVTVGVYYASYFWLLYEDRVHSWDKDGIQFALRWMQFVKVRIDFIPLFEKATGIKVPEWLKTIIRTISVIAFNEKINSSEEYELLANKQELENKYQLALSNEGYGKNFFIALNNGTINSDRELV